MSKPFDIYAAYSVAVQDPDLEACFLRDTYRELRGRAPRTLREDFCAAFALSCAWVKLGRNYQAVGVDLDKVPLDYGRAHHLPQLTRNQQQRLSVLQRNVLSPRLPPADVIGAMNFSHYIFKDRRVMARYFRGCHAALLPKGIFVAFCFGGPACAWPHTERRELPGFTYYFQEESFDPVTNFATFHIHFKPARQKRIERAFTYDWRMWSIPEIRDLMRDAGFRRTHVYWEDFDRNGNGSGIHRRRDVGEECEAWTAYVIGEK